MTAGSPGLGATFATHPVFARPPPVSQLGIQLHYRSTQVMEVVLGVFNNNPNSAAGKHHDLDRGWRAGNRGAFAIAQIHWLRNQGTRDAGMLSRYSIGDFSDGKQFLTIDGTPALERSNRGVYLMA
ncbi:MAG: carbohydrate porin [Candidatus Dechloromonas phosphoritropha]